jgi:hypothetical protein
LVRPEACDVDPQPPAGVPDGECDIDDALRMARCQLDAAPCALVCAPFRCPVTAAPRSIAAAAAVPVRLVVSPDHPVPGAIATIELVVESASTPIGAYGATLGCDDEVLGVIEVTGGATPAFEAPPPAVIEGCGARIAAFQATALDEPRGRVSLARIAVRLAASTSAGAVTTIRPETFSLFDANGLPIPTTVEPASVTIGSACTAPCDDGDLCTVDECTRVDGCVHVAPAVVDAGAVRCVAANVRVLVSTMPRGLERRLARLERLLQRATSVARPGQCRRRSRAVARTAGGIERFLVRRAARLLPEPAAARLRTQAGRLHERARLLHGLCAGEAAARP